MGSLSSPRQVHPCPNPCNPTQDTTIHILKRQISLWWKGLPKRAFQIFLSPQSSWDRRTPTRKEPMRSFLCGKPTLEISLKGLASHSPFHPQPSTLLACKGIGCPLLLNPRNPFPAPKLQFSPLAPTQRSVFSCSSVLWSVQKQQSLKSFCFQTLQQLLQLQSRSRCGDWRSWNKSWLIMMYFKIYICWWFQGLLAQFSNS